MTTEEPTPAARPARIKDVADLAGVSWKTVSNVVNGRTVVAPATRERVEQAIAELGYRPSLAGRSLQSGRSRMITLAVPDLTNPYFAALTHAVIGEAATRGYTVLTDVTGGDPERERKVAGGYYSLLHDGIIFSPISLDVDEIRAVRDVTPLVFLGERIVGQGVDHVAIDNVASARELTDHLISLGHRRIAFVGHTPRPTVSTATLREQGYRESLAGAGITVDDRLIVTEMDYSRDGGEAAAEFLLTVIDEVDAVVCGNDLLAIGVIHRLQQSGVRVPEQVSVAGWDNTPDGAYFTPALTTIAPDIETMARYAVEALIARIDEPSREGHEIAVGHTLVVRDSTGPHPTGHRDRALQR